MRILLDMNLSPDWVGFLRQEGFDAVSIDRISSRIRVLPVRRDGTSSTDT